VLRGRFIGFYQREARGRVAPKEPGGSLASLAKKSGFRAIKSKIECTLALRGGANRAGIHTLRSLSAEITNRPLTLSGCPLKGPSKFRASRNVNASCGEQEGEGRRRGRREISRFAAKIAAARPERERRRVVDRRLLPRRDAGLQRGFSLAQSPS